MLKIYSILFLFHSGDLIVPDDDRIQIIDIDKADLLCILIRKVLIRISFIQ